MAVVLGLLPEPLAAADGAADRHRAVGEGVAEWRNQVPGRGLAARGLGAFERVLERRAAFGQAALQAERVAEPPHGYGEAAPVAELSEPPHGFPRDRPNLLGIGIRISVSAEAVLMKERECCDASILQHRCSLETCLQ